MWTSRLFFLVGCWIMILALLQLVPFFSAVAYGEGDVASSFFASMSLSFLIGGSLFLGFRSSDRVKVRKLTILLPIVGGISLAFAAGLPFFFLFPDSGLIPAFFEGMSLITTSGSSAYEGALDDAKALQLWRAMAAWFGGFLAVCVSLSLLVAMNSGGMQLYRSPLPFGDSEKGYPRLKATALALFPVYLLFTAFCCFLLMLDGTPFQDSIMLAMATISTTGIAPTTGHVVTGIWTQIVICVFSLLAVMNWDLHYSALRHLKPSNIVRHEFRALFLVTGCGFLALLFFAGELDIETIWHNLFATVSAVTTTGFSDGQDKVGGENVAAAIVVMCLACMGGAVAGTSGGLKQLRLIVVFMLGRQEIDRLAHPHGVKTLRFEEEVVQRRDIECVWLLVGGFVLLLVVGALSFAVLGIDFQESVALSFSAITLSGPLVSIVDPFFAGYSGLHDADYLVLSVLMLIGRIEASLFLALFARSMWRG